MFLGLNLAEERPLSGALAVVYSLGRVHEHADCAAVVEVHQDAGGRHPGLVLHGRPVRPGQLAGHGLDGVSGAIRRLFPKGLIEIASNCKGP